MRNVSLRWNSFVYVERDLESFNYAIIVKALFDYPIGSVGDKKANALYVSSPLRIAHEGQLGSCPVSLDRLNEDSDCRPV